MNKDEVFRQIYQRYHKPLVAYAKKFVFDDERANDMAQETFRKLFVQDLDKLEGRMPQWLFTVCKNTCFKFTRTNSRYSYTDELPDSPAEQSDPSEDLILKEDVKLVQKAMRKLKPNQRKVIRLRYFQNYSYESIAKKSKLSLGNVGFQLHTAIKNLKKLMDSYQKKENISLLTV